MRQSRTSSTVLRPSAVSSTNSSVIVAPLNTLAQPPTKPEAAPAPETSEASAEGGDNTIADQVSDLQEQIRAMQEKLDRLSKDKGD